EFVADLARDIGQAEIAPVEARSKPFVAPGAFSRERNEHYEPNSKQTSLQSTHFSVTPYAILRASQKERGRESAWQAILLLALSARFFEEAFEFALRFPEVGLCRQFQAIQVPQKVAWTISSGSGGFS
ncbi:MAG: hypothetical protein ABGZ17_24890, partial [Planctomycetaceae bacterium]